jgi:chemotaxis response regulator CheB
MGRIRVFIVSDSLTFSDGLKSLLTTDAKIIGQEVDTGQAIARIKALKPEVVIWANTGMKPDALLEETQLLEATPLIRTVSLNLQNNVIVIHHLGRKRVRVAHDTQDLIEAVKYRLFPSPAKRKRPNLMHRLNRSWRGML